MGDGLPNRTDAGPPVTRPGPSESVEADMLDVLSRVGQAITASFEFEDIFAAIEQHVGSLLDTTTLYIGLLDPSGEWLDIPLFVDGGQRTDSRRFRVDDPVRRACQAVREGREVLKETTPEEAAQRDLPGTAMTLSGLFRPLIVQGRTIGVISVQSPRPGAYGKRERRIFRMLCAFAAVALLNAENFRRLAALQPLEILGQVGQVLTGSLDHREILAALEHQVGRLLDLDGFHVALLDETGRLAFPVVVDDGRPVIREPIDVDDPGSADAEAVRERRTIAAPGLGSLHGPLLRGSRCIGTLAVRTARPEGFGERETLLFRSLCASLSAALANASAYAEVEAARIRADQALADLRRVQQDLVESERLASLGELVAGVAHEVNTPVGMALTVATTLERLAAEFAPRIDGTLRRSDLLAFTGSVAEAGRQLTLNLMRASELVSRFRQVAADRASDQRRRFDLSEVVAAILTSLTSELKRLPHRLEVEIPAGILCDSFPGALGQIVVNLVMNAATHAFPDDRAGTIRLRAEVVGDRAVLTVGDDGVGMPDEILANIFNPFFTTRRDMGGTGLGLYIAYNLSAQTLGGRLTAQSRPGAGSAFRLVMPLSAPPDLTALAAGR